MANQHNISLVALVRPQPLAKVVSGNLNGAIRLVPRVNLGVDGVRLGQHRLEQRVHVGGEGAERLVVAQEAMDVDDEKSASRGGGEVVAG